MRLKLLLYEHNFRSLALMKSMNIEVQALEDNPFRLQEVKVSYVGLVDILVFPVLSSGVL